MGFAVVLAVLKPERLKADRARKKFASNVFSRWSNPNNKPQLGRSCSSVLRAVVGGVGACCTVVTVAMVEGVRVGIDTGRGATEVKVQVSKILPKIKQTVNEQLEAEVLTQSSNSSQTSYAVAADLSEMELKKILIEKMEGNKSIHRSNEQRNLYKALVEAYESDKIILDTYGETVTLKRRRDDDSNKDEEPSAGSDRGSKRRRE
nr:hypothetical protein [Tanacetum cinerariifolium]